MGADHPRTFNYEMKLSVRVAPRSSRTELLITPELELKLKITSPPVDGEANKAVCLFFADFFGIAKTRVSVVIGQKSTQKVLNIEGLDPLTAQKKLEKALGVVFHEPNR
ncbi:MAG: DUF167 domain-containing protein [Brevinema sp.]